MSFKNRNQSCWDRETNWGAGGPWVERSNEESMRPLGLSVRVFIPLKDIDKVTEAQSAKHVTQWLKEGEISKIQTTEMEEV
jgi:uncharacterized protein YggL (DUF469 family)